MSDRGRTIRLATRGSDLALRQAAIVQEGLESRRRRVELVEVETTGDQLRDELIHRLGTTGAFVRSLDEKVLAGEVDAAVHSMKDVPTEDAADLVIAGIPERTHPGDVLVTPDGADLEGLPEGATVGTASLRRGAMLQAVRPDLVVEPLRGNVDTRVAKLLAPSLQREHQARVEAEEEVEPSASETTDENDEENDDETDGGDDGESESQPAFERSVEAWFDDLSEVERRALEREVETEYDAIVLAVAGLERLGLAHHVPTTPLDRDAFVPAPGQGAIAVAAPEGDLAEMINDAIDHPPTRVETTVERTILDRLGGGCVAPVGIHARLQGRVVTARVRVLSRDGTEEVAATRELPVTEHAAAAREFAADLADQGAAELIERARRESPDEGKRDE